MSVDFTPKQNSYKNIGEFRFWCQKVLPLVYDDSISYYELLGKVLQYLNETIENINLVGDDMTRLYTAYEELQTWVNEYFDTLDTQEEINNKLNNMAKDGSLSRLINPLLEVAIEEQNEAIKGYGNNIAKQNADISVLKARMDTFTSLPDGSTADKAEIEDIRVTAYGDTSPTAGESVRKQYARLNNRKAENILYNLCSRENVASAHGNGCDVEEQEDGSVVVTATTKYATYYKRLNNILVTPIKKLCMIAQIEVLEGSVLPFGCINTCYFYDENATNLNRSAGKTMLVESVGKYVVQSIIEVTEEQQYAVTVDVSPLFDTIGAKVKVKDYILLDISNISNDVIYNIDFTKYMTDGYFENIKNVGVAKLSEKSVDSDHSIMSDIAEKAIITDVICDELLPITSDVVGGFACTIDSVIDGTITATSESTYGAPYINYETILGNRYLVVWKGDAFKEISFIKTTGSGWDTYPSKSVDIDGVTHYYSVITPLESSLMTRIYFNNINTATKSFTPVVITYVPASSVADDTYVTLAVTRKSYDIAVELARLNGNMSTITGAWVGKKVLFLGDSLTAAHKYQETVKSMLGVEVFNHCLGGAGIVDIIDGNANGSIMAINSNTVAGKDLIVLYVGYNNRSADVGKVGDLYTKDGKGSNNIAGYMQYAINRIYECLKEANNLTCKVMVVTLDCAGRYDYIDADGYEEYPSGSGRTMETIANIQKAVAEYNSLPCCDLWHNSCINRFTWNVYGASDSPVNEMYSPYQLDSTGEAISSERIRYVKGTSYYQIRGGEVVLEEYTGNAPYPYNGDQLHKSAEGYRQIGECIVGTIVKAFGK